MPASKAVRAAQPPECLDRMLITGERRLRLDLGEYVDHFGTHTPALALGIPED